MKYLITAIALLFTHFAEARNAGTITLTPSSTLYDTAASGQVYPGDPDLWTIDLSAFPGAVSLTITLVDNFQPYPDDYDVSLNGVFIGNTLAATGRTFQATVSPNSNLLKIAYVNTHTGAVPSAGGSLYNLRIVASVAVADPLTAGIETYAGVRIAGTVGSSYRVEYTFDLASPNWTKAADIVLPSSPYVYFDLVPMTATSRRFYRVVAVP